MADSGLGSPVDHMDHHFPSFEERARASTKQIAKNGRISPTHSAHGNLIRSSIIRMQAEKKAKKVRFYRNGDRFFKGLVYAVSPERFRTMESLLAELTNSPIGDKNVLPNGVRHVFTLDGTKKIGNVEQLEEEESYVCASTAMFKKIDYPKSNTPIWNPNARGTENESPRYKTIQIEGDEKDYVHPKLITVIRNGSKPRKAIRILLNRRTAHSLDQVLTDITEAIKLDSGAVRRLFTIDGRQVISLHDLFKDDSVFIAYGQERYSYDDFDLSENEVKFVSAYKTVRNKERITLKSPKPPRKALSARVHHDNGMEIPKYRTKSAPVQNGSPRSSPRMSRKNKAKSPGPTRKTPTRLSNGNGDMNGYSVSIPVELSLKYKIGNMIGEGNFAEVRECEDKLTGKQHALKIISKNRCKGREHMIENEVSILRVVKHPNIIQLEEDYDMPNELYLVMEFVNGGDLFDAISMSTKYTERDACGMVYNLASALKYLHSMSIVHRDIKPENLLVCEYPDGTKSIKLGDFGLATVVDGTLTTICGTPTYVAPEILSEKGYGLEVDIWSAGVIAYILLCGFPPFASTTNDQDELFQKIIAGDLDFPSPFWDDISDSAKDLITGMLTLNPAERYTADDVLNHPWVRDDTAKDQDLHLSIAGQINENFHKKLQKDGNAGAALIAATALDHQSRYFQPKHHIEYTTNGHHAEDEVF